MIHITDFFDLEALIFFFQNGCGLSCFGVIYKYYRCILFVLNITQFCIISLLSFLPFSLLWFSSFAWCLASGKITGTMSNLLFKYCFFLWSKAVYKACNAQKIGHAKFGLTQALICKDGINHGMLKMWMYANT